MRVLLVDIEKTLPVVTRAAIECFRKEIGVRCCDRPLPPHRGRFARVSLENLLKDEEEKADYYIFCTQACTDNIQGRLIDNARSRAAISSYRWDRELYDTRWYVLLLSLIVSAWIDRRCERECLLNGEEICDRFSIRHFHMCAECRDAIQQRNPLVLEEIETSLHWAWNRVLPIAKEATSLPICSLICEHLKERVSFQKFTFIFVLHLLADLEPLLWVFERLGLSPNKAVVIGKPYPYAGKKDLVFRLREKGYTILLASEIDADESGETIPSSLVQEAISHVRMDKKSLGLIVVEDGGYCAREFLRAKEIGNLRGIVEQTTKGHRISEDAEKEGVLNFPVISVAKTKIKNTYEAPLVGSTVADNIRRLLPEEHTLGKCALVLGFGPIGKAVATSLKDTLGFRVHVIEPKDFRRIEARTGSLDIAGVYESFSESRRGCNPMIVVGTTGKKSLTINELLQLPDNTYIVSASSDRVEFPISELEKISKNNVQVVNPGVACYTLPAGSGRKALNVLADGYPINFYSSASVPNKSIDPILAMLLIGTEMLARNKLEPGLHIELIEQESTDLRLLKLVENYLKTGLPTGEEVFESE